MKKICMFLSVLLLLSVFLMPLSAYADVTYNHGYYKYWLEDGGITICLYFGKEETVEIPNQIGGKPVSKIAAGAFTDCTNVKTVILPESIMTVEDSSFGNWITIDNSKTFWAKMLGESGTGNPNAQAGQTTPAQTETTATPAPTTPAQSETTITPAPSTPAPSTPAQTETTATPAPTTPAQAETTATPAPTSIALTETSTASESTSTVVEVTDTMQGQSLDLDAIEQNRERIEGPVTPAPTDTPKPSTQPDKESEAAQNEVPVAAAPAPEAAATPVPTEAPAAPASSSSSAVPVLIVLALAACGGGWYYLRKKKDGKDA